MSDCVKYVLHPKEARSTKAHAPMLPQHIDACDMRFESSVVFKIVGVPTVSYAGEV